jgi:hypothetical protein
MGSWAAIYAADLINEEGPRMIKACKWTEHTPTAGPCPRCGSYEVVCVGRRILNGDECLFEFECLNINCEAIPDRKRSNLKGVSKSEKMLIALRRRVKEFTL